jgi:hypothetical protein
MEDEVNELFAQFELLQLNAEDEDFDPNDLQDNFYTLLEKVQDLIRECFEEDDEDRLEELEKKMKSFKAEQNFYDAEDELNRMFPERGEDDFDDDSTSYNSAFGED